MTNQEHLESLPLQHALFEFIKKAGCGNCIKACVCGKRYFIGTCDEVKNKLDKWLKEEHKE